MLGPRATLGRMSHRSRKGSRPVTEDQVPTDYKASRLNKTGRKNAMEEGMAPYFDGIESAGQLDEQRSRDLPQVESAGIHRGGQKKAGTRN